MTALCQKIWEEKWPKKKGKLKLCENNWTISLISHPSKAMLRILLNRVKSKVEQLLTEEQAGFRPGRNTVLLVSIRSIITLRRSPLCKLLNQHLSNLAQKFPETKCLRSVSSLCIPNYPDKNLPTIFVYKEGEMKKQFVGPLAFGGMNLKKDELEWMLSQTGAINTDLEEAPWPEVEDVMNIAIRDSAINRGDDDDDDY